MSFDDLLLDRCSLYRKVVSTSGMNDTETYELTASDVPCRVFKNSATLYNANKVQHATMIRTRVAFLSSQSVPVGGRIEHEGRRYEIVDVFPTSTADERHHQVAVCEVVAGVS